MTEELEPLSKRIPNRKHRLFIDELFKNNQNATRAYIAVYDTDYETAMASSSRLLRNVKIKEEIERRLQENAMGANEVIYRLAEQARSDLGEFAHIESSNDLANHPLSRIAKKFKKNIWYDKNGDRHESIEIELYDGQSALVTLGKYHSLFTDKVEHKHSGEIDIKIVGGLDLDEI